MLVPLKSEKRPKGEPMYRDPDNPFNREAPGLANCKIGRWH